jgi:hypothetical protein
MIRIGDLNLSYARFTLRILAGLILAGLILFLFYYLPSHLTQLLSPYVPEAYIPYLNNIVSALTNTGIPLLGILLAIIIFFDILLKGSWIYGMDLILTGVLFLAYDLFLYRAGKLFSEAYQSSQSAIYSEIAPLFDIIIIILIISTVYSIGMGVSLVMKRNRRKDRIP